MLSTVESRTAHLFEDFYGPADAVAVADGGTRNSPTSLVPSAALFTTVRRFQCSLGAMLSADLCIAGLVAESSDGVVRALAQRLLAAGHVRPSFEGAVISREKRSPTGLPFPGRAIAMPHAEPDHVVRPAIAVASLATPVFFRQMGAPGTRLEVSLVVMPALTDKEQATGELSRLVGLLQDEALRSALAQAATSQAIYEALVAVSGHGSG